MMKKLYLLICLLLIPFVANAGIVASGSVTQANAKKSLVDGSAFIDIAVDLSPYAHADSGDHKHIFKLIDSNGKVAYGFVGASGGGETLGGELLTGFTNHASYPYDTFSTSGVDISSVIALAATRRTAYSNQFADQGLGALLKFTRVYNLNSGAPHTVYIGTSTSLGGSTSFGIYDTVKYGTVKDPAQRYIGYYGVTVTNFTATNHSLKKVTDCSTNGLHILSTKSGSVQNWADIESGFDYNSSTGYTWEIKTVGKGASFW